MILPQPVIRCVQRRQSICLMLASTIAAATMMQLAWLCLTSHQLVRGKSATLHAAASEDDEKFEELEQQESVKNAMHLGHNTTKANPLRRKQVTSTPSAYVSDQPRHINMYIYSYYTSVVIKFCYFYVDCGRTRRILTYAILLICPASMFSFSLS